MKCMDTHEYVSISSDCQRYEISIIIPIFQIRKQALGD